MDVNDALAKVANHITPFRPTEDSWRAAAIALAAEVRRLREERRWIPCSERLPPLTSGDMLIRCGTTLRIAMQGGDGYWYTPEAHKVIATHWQPLPEGPGGDG